MGIHEHALMLLKLSKSFQSKDEQKNTCLHLSAVHGHDHILKFLLDNSKLNLKAFNRFNNKNL